MSIYNDWGYISNPFQTSPLKGNEKGTNLLIGRDAIKKKLIQRILSNSGIISIEGVNGIGKTSLINVCLFEVFNKSVNGGTKQLYIPCIEPFQLTRDCDIKEFSDNIIFTVVQTLLKYSTKIKNIKKSNKEIQYIDRWLNTPQTQSISAQVMAFGAGESTEINTSEGYLKSGFKKQLLDWLNVLFPSNEDGGVVCVIDNLELLKTSTSAKETMEILRDELFTLNGMKWIFSGSHGVINSIAASPRMSGYLLDPISIDSLSSTYLPSLLSSRIESFQNHRDTKPYSPITTSDFNSLYKSLNGNLRETFNKLSSLCLHIAELPEDPFFEQDKNSAFQEWFIKDQEKVFNSIKRSCSDTDFALLKMIKYQKDYSTDKVREIGYSEISEILESITQLENHGLIAIPIYEQLDINQLNRDYGEIATTEDAANKLMEDYLFKILYNVQISPKGYYIENLY